MYFMSVPARAASIPVRIAPAGCRVVLLIEQRRTGECRWRSDGHVSQGMGWPVDVGGAVLAMLVACVTSLRSRFLQQKATAL